MLPKIWKKCAHRPLCTGNIICRALAKSRPESRHDRHRTRRHGQGRVNTSQSRQAVKTPLSKRLLMLLQPAPRTPQQQFYIARRRHIQEITIGTHGFMRVGVGIKQPGEQLAVFRQEFAGGFLPAQE